MKFHYLRAVGCAAFALMSMQALASDAPTSTGIAPDQLADIPFWSTSAIIYGRGVTTEAEGIEMVATTRGELIDASGTVRMTRAGMSIAGLNRDTALLSVQAPSGLDSCRMFITLPSRGTRFEPSEFEQRRAELRRRNTVRAIAETDSDGKLHVRRLD